MQIRKNRVGYVSVCFTFVSLAVAKPAFAEKAFIEGSCRGVNASIYVERFAGTDLLFVARCELGTEPCATLYAGSVKALCDKEQNVGIAERGAKITLGVASFLAAGPGIISGVLGRAKDAAFVANDVNQLSQELGSENCPTTKGLLSVAAFDGTGREKESCLIGGLLQRVWQLNIDNSEFDREAVIRHKKAKPRPGADPSVPADYTIDAIQNDALEKIKALIQAHRQPSSVGPSVKAGASKSAGGVKKETKPSTKPSEPSEMKAH